jgi:hypothetical protein
MSSKQPSRSLPDTWELNTLESLLAVSIGGIWGVESGLSEVNVDVVRVTELKAHGFIEPSTAAKRSITRKQFQSRALEVGDLLLEKSGGGPNTPVGRVGYVLSIDKPMVCSNFMQLMRPDAKKVFPKYLHFFLQISATSRLLNTWLSMFPCRRFKNKERLLKFLRNNFLVLMQLLRRYVRYERSRLAFVVHFFMSPSSVRSPATTEQQACSRLVGQQFVWEIALRNSNQGNL